MTAPPANEPREVVARIAVIVCECGQYNVEVPTSWSLRGSLDCRCGDDRSVIRYTVTAKLARPEPLRAMDVEGEVTHG